MKRVTAVLTFIVLSLSSAALALPGATEIAPSVGSTVSNRPTFTWTAVGGAIWYRVWANPTGAGANQLFCTDPFYGAGAVDPQGCWVQGGTTHVQTQDLTPGNWMWFVHAWSDASRGADWSPGVNFNVAAAANPAWVRVTKSGGIESQSGGFTVTRAGSTNLYYNIENPSIPNFGDLAPVATQMYDGSYTNLSMVVYRVNSTTWRVWGATSSSTTVETGFTFNVPTKP